MNLLVSMAVRPLGSILEVAEMISKPSPAPLQKHPLGGCIIDRPCVGCRFVAPHRLAAVNKGMSFCHLKAQYNQNLCSNATKF